MLHQTFLTLADHYTDNDRLKNELWTEIVENYTGRKRHYHTLKHLEHLLAQLTAIKDRIQQWDAVMFALYYHDIVYDALRSDNEEKSAGLAEKRMRQLTVPTDIIEQCNTHILATKTHIRSSNSDTDHFTDADLAILGQPWETYTQYYQGVRKEYSIYPDFLYNPGRKKVLTHFLSMECIFKTDHFRTLFETQAKQNLQQELELLS